MFHARRAALASGLIAGVLGIGLGSGLVTITDRMISVIDPPAAVLDPHRMVSADEIRAAIVTHRKTAGSGNTNPGPSYEKKITGDNLDSLVRYLASPPLP